MGRFSKKGYHVKENAPVYFTLDMDATAKWFENALGWYSNIVERDENGSGCYGVVFEVLPEVELAQLVPFTGIQMFRGEPAKTMISFMQVTNIQNLYDYVISSGWSRITEISQQPWGGKTCTLTTVDGYTIHIFQ